MFFNRRLADASDNRCAHVLMCVFQYDHMCFLIAAVLAQAITPRIGQITDPPYQSAPSRGRITDTPMPKKVWRPKKEKASKDICGSCDKRPTDQTCICGRPVCTAWCYMDCPLSCNQKRCKKCLQYHCRTSCVMRACICQNCFLSHKPTCPDCGESIPVKGEPCEGDDPGDFWPVDYRHLFPISTEPWSDD